MTRLLQFLIDLATPGFFGCVTIRFVRGEPVSVRVQRDYLVTTLPPSRGHQIVTVTPAGGTAM